MTELNYRQVDRDILATLAPPGRTYYFLLLFLLAVLAVGVGCWIYQARTGMGVAGIQHPVGWGVYITNFVFWVGIAHSGTLISAILFLLRARWRTSIFRSAEIMTLFAIATAGLFPLVHLGRTWYFYWLLPYPNQRLLWVNFRSPLMWDVFAVSTYLTVSLLFLFVGMIPDNAAIRDRSTGWRRLFHAAFSFGWKGTDRQWKNYHGAYLFLAAVVTPLVVSVHSVVSWDFAISIIPGWHSTIFAPYFVAGAIFSGIAMVILLLVPLRRVFRLEAYITSWHFDNLAKVLLFTSLIISYSYLMEVFMPWYSGHEYESAIMDYRAMGPYSPLFWLMIFGNSLLPLALVFARCRRSIPVLVTVSLFVTIGMWLERFIIIVTSLAHEYEPYAWGEYVPSAVEAGITAGSFAWFFLLFLVFIKLFPSVSIEEVKEPLKMPAEKEGTE